MMIQPVLLPRQPRRSLALAFTEAGISSCNLWLIFKGMCSSIYPSDMCTALQHSYKHVFLLYPHCCAQYAIQLPKEVRLWERDRINVAANLVRSAVILAAAAAATNTADNTCQDETYEQPNLPLSIAMLRPSMVPIVNVMQGYDRRIQSTMNQAENDKVKDDLLHSLDEEIGKCVDLGVETIVRYYNQQQVKKKKKKKKKSSSSLSTSERFTIGTFSRSSTMKNILLRVIQETSKQEDQQSSSSAVAEEEARINIICSQSTPGDEGKIMASDIPNEVHPSCGPYSCS